MHPLREMRKAKHLTQREFAALSGVSRETIINTERGYLRPYMVTRGRMLRALGRPIAEHRAIFGPLPRRDAPCEHVQVNRRDLEENG